MGTRLLSTRLSASARNLPEVKTARMILVDATQRDMACVRREMPGVFAAAGAEQGHGTDPASTALGNGGTACLPGSRV